MDPESNFRKGPTLTTFFLVDEGISGAIISPPAKRRLIFPGDPDQYC